MEFYYKRTTVPKANQFYIYKTMFLKGLPIRRINFSDPADRQRHDQMVALVERMLALPASAPPPHTPTEQTMLQHRSPPPTRRLTAWSTPSTA